MKTYETIKRTETGVQIITEMEGDNFYKKEVQYITDLNTLSPEDQKYIQSRLLKQSPPNKTIDKYNNLIQQIDEKLSYLGGKYYEMSNELMDIERQCERLERRRDNTQSIING